MTAYYFLAGVANDYTYPYEIRALQPGGRRCDRSKGTGAPHQAFRNKWAKTYQNVACEEAQALGAKTCTEDCPFPDKCVEDKAEE